MLTILVVHRCGFMDEFCAIGNCQHGICLAWDTPKMAHVAPIMDIFYVAGPSGSAAQKQGDVAARRPSAALVIARTGIGGKALLFLPLSRLTQLHRPCLRRRRSALALTEPVAEKCNTSAQALSFSTATAVVLAVTVDSLSGSAATHSDAGRNTVCDIAVTVVGGNTYNEAQDFIDHLECLRQGRQRKPQLVSLCP